MQPIPFGSLFDRPVRQPDTEYDIIVGRARRAELARKEQRKAQRRAQRRQRLARVLGR
jgi:hypothetical protein